MPKKLICALIVMLLLSACGPQEFAEDVQEPVGRKNPKNPDVAVVTGFVTIKIPGHTPFFWLEKVSDDSVPYSKIYFKFDLDDGKFYYQTNLEDWQLVVTVDGNLIMGQVEIVFGDKEIMITYPSGTWAFP